MKIIYKLIVFVFLLIPSLSNAQNGCLEADYEDKCVKGLFDVFDDYLYLRSRPFSYKDDSVMYAVTLKRNLLYIFNICDASGKEDAVINLYDKNDKLVTTSINPKTKLNDKIITFKPTAAGKYYISTVSRYGKKSCSLLLFGLIEKNVGHYLPAQQ